MSPIRPNTRSRGLIVAPADGDGPPRVPDPALDRSVGNGAWADLVMADDMPGPLGWTTRRSSSSSATAGATSPIGVGLDGEVDAD